MKKLALFAKENPQFDYGIHLTLTCEWERYKFGPVLPVSEVQSLVDENGHFFKNREMLRNSASAAEIKNELHAQIEKAYACGLKPSHLDSHMYSVGAREDFFRVYKELGAAYNLPVLLNFQLMEMVGLNDEQLLSQDDLTFDQVYVGKFEDFSEGNLPGYYNDVLKNMKSGLNIILIHPAFDDDEMKAVTVNHPNFGSKWRQIDFDYFISDECRQKIKENNIDLINWKDLKIEEKTNF
ncbi:MAG: polysaccharide deacetylase family protein [Flavobacteriaceae bacterium]|nr:polysaccharide deacetylase family protein [Flavobacteriaceae bacterium]